MLQGESSAVSGSIRMLLFRDMMKLPLLGVDTV